MAHQVELSDHVYQKIQQAAEQQGITPSEWIEAAFLQTNVPTTTDKETITSEQYLGDVLQGIVGSFDSSKEQYDNRRVNPMAEMVADKLQKQGVEIPWRRQR